MNSYLAAGFFLPKNILTQMCSFCDLKRKRTDLLDVKYSSIWMEAEDTPSWDRET